LLIKQLLTFFIYFEKYYKKLKLHLSAFRLSQPLCLLKVLKNLEDSSRGESNYPNKTIISFIHYW